MLPNLSGALSGWISPYQVVSITPHTTDFTADSIETVRTIRALVQPADPERLNVDQIDWSLRYIQIHTVDALAVGEYLVSNGTRYKVISGGDWSAYGFRVATGEEVK